VVFLEADLSFSPGDIPRLLETAVAGGYDCVCGSPFLGSFEGMPPLRRLLTGAANLLLRARFGRSITSYTQIFKLYRAAALLALEFESEGFTIDAELLAKTLARGLKVAEVPVIMKARRQGRSKMDIAAEIFSCLKLVIRGVGGKAR
jgi:dolichol-phosphate mannosyltransferase